MYKILIVDDEEIVRRSIIKIIDWNSLGFSEVFQAENGIEALDIALKEKPHLILTDISMPYMDGLQLTSKIKETLPSTYIVIFSGYDDFLYAQEAIGLQVLDYILKPLGAASLSKKMQDIKKRLDDELKEKAYFLKIKNQLQESLPVLKESFLYSLVCTPGNKSDIEGRLNFFDIPILDEPYAVIVIESDLSGINPSDLEVYSFAVKNLTMEVLGKSHQVFSEPSGRVVVVLCLSLLPSEDGTRNNLYETLIVLKKSINLNLNIQATIGIGAEVADAGSLYSSYCGAVRSLDFKYTLGKNKVYDIYDLDPSESTFLFPHDYCQEFITAVKTYNTKEINQALLNVSELLKGKNSPSVTTIKLVFVELITNLLKFLSETKQISSSSWLGGLGLFSQMEKLDTIDEMYLCILRYSESITKELSDNRTSSSKMLVKHAMEYIKKNYHIVELSLNNVAAEVSVSPVYLSSLFKKEAKINFSDYVTKVRMEKAMEMLKTTSLKTFEIAYETGFSDSHYFSISFKKFTGTSPSEYREDK